MCNMKKTTVGAAVGLTLALLSATAAAIPIGWSVQSDGDGNLYRIDLATGVATAVGLVGFDAVEGLSFQPATGVLFGVDELSDQLLTINTTTGAATVVGGLGIDADNPGLAFDGAGNLFLADDNGDDLYSVNPTSGATTLIGNMGDDVVSLAFRTDTLFGLTDDNPNGELYTLDTGAGAGTLVADLGSDASGDQDGIEFDPATGILWGVGDSNNNVFTINPTTGATTLIADLTGCTGCSIDGDFESLAIRGPAPTPVPAPAVLALFGLGLGLLMLGSAGRVRRLS